MDHELTGMWLSVDPMADKYPNVSPYNYCMWNPIKMIDPDGKDWYDLLEDGTLVRNEEKSKEYQNTDVIWSVRNKILSKELSHGTLSEQKRGRLGENVGSYVYLNGSRSENVDVFTFCADNSNVEFTLMEFAGDDPTVKATVLTTSHKERYVGVPSTDDFGTAYAKKHSSYLVSHLHNHIGNTQPSGDDYTGDISFRNAINDLRMASGINTPVLWGIYKCRGQEKYTTDWEGNKIDPITMRDY